MLPVSASTVSDDGELTILPSAPVVWKAKRDLAALKTTPALLKPRVRNESSLDVLFWDPAVHHHWPIDCTVSEKHGVHAEGLYTTVSALGWTLTDGWPKKPHDKGKNRSFKIKYFWAVPEDRFRFGWTKEQGPKDGTVKTPEAQAMLAHVVQYAVCVPSQVQARKLAEIALGLAVPLPHELLDRLAGQDGGGTQARLLAPASGAAAAHDDGAPTSAAGHDAEPTALPTSAIDTSAPGDTSAPAAIAPEKGKGKKRAGAKHADQLVGALPARAAKPGRDK